MKAILIPVNEMPKLIELEDGLEPLQQQVGGFIQALPVPDARMDGATDRTDATVYINENGKFECLDGDGNPAVNLLATVFMKPALFPDDCIVGPMLVCGFDPATGENQDVPDELVSSCGLDAVTSD